MLEKYRRKAVEWTQSLVRIPNVNPPGGEAEVARFCAEQLRGAGFDVAVDEFAPGRANLVAYLGNREDLGIVFNGHMDVVPADGEWKLCEPFGAEEKDGMIWGRGSADMKSGCAAAMAAARAVAESGEKLKKGICLCFVADEERVNKGAKRLMETTQIKADACVVCEPTQLQVHYGHRGYASFFIRTYGKPCHASVPSNGVNAIYKMAHAIELLEKYADRLAENCDPLLGRMSLSVGMIHGGVALNVVPPFCEIEVEIRPYPWIDAAMLQSEMQEFLGDLAKVDIRSNLRGSIIPLDSELVRRASACVAQATGKDAVVARFPACSEASFFSVGYGIPTILLGPGDIGCAHKPDERVAIAEIQQAVSVYLDLIRHYCSDTNIE